MDAHLRDYHLIIPSDCVVSQDTAENAAVLKYMQCVLEADVRTSNEIVLSTDYADSKHG